MDELTIEAFQAAYKVGQEQRGRKGDSITIDDLLWEASYVWAKYRDNQIEKWADRLAASCAPRCLPDLTLEDLVCEIGDKLLVDWNIVWEVPLWEAEGTEEYIHLREEQITFVSWGIATLWWLALEGSEIAPLLNYTSAEAETWLKEKQRAESLIFRRKTKSGQVITQRRMFAA